MQFISSRYLEEEFLISARREKYDSKNKSITVRSGTSFHWFSHIKNTGVFDTIIRDIELNVIKDLVEGRAFEHWFRYKVSKKALECTDIDYRDLYVKTFIYFNFIKMLVEDIAMQCPVMENFEPKQNLKEKDIKYLKEELEDLDWISTSIDIVKELETKGDCFYQIYYDENLKKHRLLKLKSENMIDIIVEEDNIKYIYKNTRIEKSLDLEKSLYTRRKVNDLIIFTNGYYVEYSDVTNLDINSSKNKKLVVNSESMGNMLPIIHIKGKYKKVDSEFSEIPAIDYIDCTFDTNTVITDIRSSNRNAGSPKLVVINGELDFDRSVLDAGGLIHIDTPDKLKNFHSRNIPETNVKSFEITNSLSSLNKELTFYLDFLYRIVGLIPPTLQEKMGSSDSSKVIAQFRTKQEVKNKFYMTSIRKSFSEFFGLLLKDLNKRSKLEKVFLQIPKILVTSSPYDNLSLLAQEMGLGLTTMQNYMKEQGYTEEQIQEILNNKKESLEIMETNSTETMEVVENNLETEVSDNTTGLDNKFKQT